MFGVGLVELVALVLLVVLVVTLVVRAGRRRTPPPPLPLAGSPSAADPPVPPATVAREWRLVRLTRGLGVVLGLVVGAQVVQQGGYGVGAMLAPAAFGLCVLLGVTLGETVVRPRRDAGVRSASLTPRRPQDYLPRGTTTMVGVMTVLSAATLLLTTLTATRNDHTDSMRALSCRTGQLAQSHTPYPGSFYTVPLALLLVLVLLTAALGARQVVRRPRGMASSDAGDDVLRRSSLHVIVAATGIAVCAPYAGLALVTSSALSGLASGEPSCAAGWMPAAAIAMGVLSLASLVVGAICVVNLFLAPAEQVSSARPRTPAPR